MLFRWILWHWKIAMTKNNEVLILLDADVVIHFFKAERLSLLFELYPQRLCMLDVVLKELQKNPTIKANVENLFTFKHVKEIEFTTGSSKEIFLEYNQLKKSGKGDGESATMIYCKHHAHIIASSNTRDIKAFCETYSVAYLTTLDILCVAVHKGKISEKEADAIIQQILHKGSKLSDNNLLVYRNNKFNQEKLMY